MKIFGFLRHRQKKASFGFAEFFLHADSKEKMRIFTEAANKANKDQMDVFKKASAKARC